MSVPRTLLFLASLASFLALLFYVGAGAVLQAAGVLGFSGLAIVVALHIPLIALLGTAWWLVGRRASAVPASAYVAARWIRDAVGEALPLTQLGGFAAGILALRMSGVAAAEAVTGQFVDLISEFLTKAPYAVVGLFALAQIAQTERILRPVLVITAAILGGAIIAWTARRRLWRAAAPAIARLAGMSAGTTQEQIRDSLKRNFAARYAVPCISLHFVCWLAGAFETWVVFRLMGKPVGPLTALAIDSLVNTLRTGGFWVPASLGVQEGSYLIVCSILGIGSAEALALSIIRRARDIAIAMTSVAWTRFWRMSRGPAQS